MKTLAVTVAATMVVLVASCTRSPQEAIADRWGMLDAYCSDCHNELDFAGEFSLQGVSPAAIAAHPEQWEEVVRKLRGNLMPPPGGPRPGVEQVKEFVAALETQLDAAAEERGAMPGWVAMHRLNRSEYETAIEDLLGVSIDVRALLPDDLASEGFDNIAEVLRVSPTYLDQYIAAAREISMKAVGDPSAEPTLADYRTSTRNRTVHRHGLPLGTRGGMGVEHYFPADGEYVFNLNVSSEPGAELRAYPQGWLEHRHRVILTINGEQVFEGELGGEDDLRAVDQDQIAAVNAIKDRFRDIRVAVKAGYHSVAATFIARPYAESDYVLQSFVPGEGIPDVPRMLGMQIVGPYEASGIGDATRSRQRIFTCYPQAEQEKLPCATQILTDLARSAFRRPVTDTDLEPLLAFYRSGSASGFEAGIQKGIFAILSSSKFLYRAEPSGAPEGVNAGAAYPVTDLELAWRLAFFLWSRGPDDELLALAERNELSEPAVYERQIRRMLADPRSKSLVTNFAFQWLSVREIGSIDPDPKLFPNFDEDLRHAFEREMELFLDSILRNADRSVVELLTAPYTFVNERLARHYGIENVRGARFRRVELAEPARWGLFGKGSVLMVTSYPDRTSPVLRGTWIMEHLLGTPPAAPPPTVETNLAPVPNDEPRSVRERLALHRTEPSCNHCHGVIDPLGQALENYNVIGEWRVEERDTGVAIDSTGEFADGRRADGPVDLREALTEEPEQFILALTEKLMTYALGRTVEYYDMPAVRAIVREAERSNYSFESIIIGVANSAPFRMRAAPEDEGSDEVVARTDGNGTSSESGGD